MAAQEALAASAAWQHPAEVMSRHVLQPPTPLAQPIHSNPRLIFLSVVIAILGDVEHLAPHPNLNFQIHLFALFIMEPQLTSLPQVSTTPPDAARRPSGGRNPTSHPTPDPIVTSYFTPMPLPLPQLLSAGVHDST
jgi:hypothetical protein